MTLPTWIGTIALVLGIIGVLASRGAVVKELQLGGNAVQLDDPIRLPQNPWLFLPALVCIAVGGALLVIGTMPPMVPEQRLMSATGDVWGVPPRSGPIDIATGDSDEPPCPPSSCRNVCAQIPSLATTFSVQAYTRVPERESQWVQCNGRGIGPWRWFDCGIGARFPLGAQTSKDLGTGWRLVCREFRNWSDDVRDARIVVTWTAVDEPPDWEAALNWCQLDEGDEDCPDAYRSLGVAHCLEPWSLSPGDLKKKRARPCAIAEAMNAARAGQTRRAVELALLCQCHNHQAQRTLSCRDGEVLEWLRSRETWTARSGSESPSKTNAQVDGP